MPTELFLCSACTQESQPECVAWCLPCNTSSAYALILYQWDNNYVSIGSQRVANQKQLDFINLELSVWKGRQVQYSVRPFIDALHSSRQNSPYNALALWWIIDQNVNPVIIHYHASEQ